MKEKLTSLWQKLFGDSVRAFGVVSLVFLASLAIAPAKNFFSEWRHYQHGYLSMIRNRSEANTLQRHFQGGIQQIWLPELGVVDRCTSCHVGLKEASLADVADAALSPASGDSAQTRSVRMHSLPSRTGRSHHGRRGAQQHAGVGTADSSGEVHRVVVRRVPSRAAARHAATESGTQPAGARRLRALPHGEVARWQRR